MQPQITAPANDRWHPLANSAGQSFALLMGAIDLAQVVVAFSTVSQYRAILIILQHQVQNTDSANTGYLDPLTLIAPLVASILSLLLGWIGNMVAVYYAGRNVARVTGSAALGRRAGLIAIALSMAAWIVLSVLGAIVTGTNGFLSTVDPYNSTPVLHQTISIVILTFSGAVVLCALAIGPYLISLALGASAGANQARAGLRVVP